MKRYTIGVDFGTLSARALLVDTQTGAEVATATMEYPHGVMSERLAASGELLPPNYALQDPADYLFALENVIPSVLKHGNVSATDVVGIGIDFTCCTLLSADANGPQESPDRNKELQSAFNSPFKPFVLSTTSIGQEGLDFHWYCRKIMHWNLPSNPVDFDQREGRINRYGSFALRQTIAGQLPAVENFSWEKDFWGRVPEEENGT